jgi:hypothetical protein
MDAHLKNKELDTQLQDNLENHGKSLANQHSQVSVKPVSNAESFVTNEKYVPKKTPAEFMPETKTEAGLVITEKMAAQYEKKRDSYHQDPTQCRIKDHFYNRDFLHLMRDLVRV